MTKEFCGICKKCFTFIVLIKNNFQKKHNIIKLFLIIKRSSIALVQFYIFLVIKQAIKHILNPRQILKVNIKICKQILKKIERLNRYFGTLSKR